ncbi:MAG: cell division protein ZapA [Deltaproteobacteria bacterium]|nr:cell division protein ZapA [Deltaproteobacteria bacterium]
MKKRIEVEIYNQTFIVNSEDDERSIRHIASYVDQRMRHKGETAKTAVPLRVAIMVTLDIADEYQKALQREADTQKEIEHLSAEHQKALQREADTQKEIERLSALILERIAQGEASDRPVHQENSLTAVAATVSETSAEDMGK